MPKQPSIKPKIAWLAISALLLTEGSNLFGQGAFEDVTSDVSIPDIGIPLMDYDASTGDGHGPGAVFADFNNDGYPDLYVIEETSTNLLYLNVPSGQERKFENVPDYLIDVPMGTVWPSTGAVAGDYDNDGDLDLYVLNSNGGLHSGIQVCAKEEVLTPNVLLQNMWMENNQQLPLLFKDVTKNTATTFDSGLATASDIGLPNSTGEILDDSITASWADVDRDGDLDLFVGNHDTNGQLGAMGDPCQTWDLPGQRDILYLNLLVEEGMPASGVPHFVDVTLGPVEICIGGVNGEQTCVPIYGGAWAEYASPVTGFQLPCNYEEFKPANWIGEDKGFETRRNRFGTTNACMFADMNGDLWPDLFVSNKGSCRERDFLYINLGEDLDGNWRGFYNITYDIDTLGTGSTGCPIEWGTFGEETPAAMGVDAGDYDNDGDLDIYMSDVETGDLWINETLNDLRISDIPDFPNGLPIMLYEPPNEPDDEILGWGINWQDFDNNGRLDLHVASGVEFRDQLFMFDIDPNDSMRNMARELGLDQMQATRGNVSADYDGDGWVDLFTVNLDGTSVLWRNRLGEMLPPEPLPPDTIHYGMLSMRLFGNPNVNPSSGLASTCDAIGAKVVIKGDFDNDNIQDSTVRYVKSGSGNAGSTNELILHVGVREATSLEVKVLWPSGRISLHNYQAPFGFVEIFEP